MSAFCRATGSWRRSHRKVRPGFAALSRRHVKERAHQAAGGVAEPGAPLEEAALENRSSPRVVLRCQGSARKGASRGETSEKLFVNPRAKKRRKK